MKLFSLILFGTLTALNIAGQSTSPPTPPDISISEWRWSAYFGHSNRLARRSSSPITSADAVARERREKNRQGSRDETSGTSSLPSAPDPFIIAPKELGNGRYGFMYRVKIENRGAKKIKAIAWEYVFLDPLDRSVISRHQFLSKVKIKPGERKEVSALNVRQPMRVVRAETASLPPVEQVFIKRVKYSDGSVWSQLD